MAGESSRKNNLNIVAEALRRTQEQYRLLAEQASDGILVTGSDGRLLDANAAAVELLGFSLNELLALRLRYVLHEEDVASDPGLLEALQGAGTSPREVRFRRKDGSLVSAEVDARPLLDGGLQVTIRDRSEQARVQRALDDSEDRFLRLLHAAPEAIALVSEGEIVLVNDAFANMLGFGHGQELQGRAVTSLIQPGHREFFRKGLQAVAGTGRTGAPFPTRLQRLDGSHRDAYVVATATSYRGQPAIQLVLRQTAPRPVMLTPPTATRDALTGLPNRDLYDDRLSVALAQAFRQRHVLAVLRLELHGLERISEALGQRAGDALLHAVGERLTTCVREGDTVARLAPSEFGVLLPGVRYQEDVITIADKVFACLADPIRVGGTDVQVGASAGISLFPEDGDGPEALMANSGTAMGRARELGPGHYRLYAADMEQDPLDALGANGNAAGLISLSGSSQESSPGVLHYQPVYSLKSERIEGFEAFLRWQHPELGLVFPRNFLSNADFTGLILAIGPWILNSAAEQIRAWQRRGHRSLRLSVNLSRHELRHRDLVRNVRTALRDTGLAPRFLQLEVPESWAMADLGRAVEVIRALRALGASVCLDGFGDDDSSLLELRRLPVDAVKLNLFGERSISRNGSDEATRVASAISMAKSFKIRVIAQGVESRDLIEQLRAWQCDEVQGYHWGPPMGPGRCDELLNQLTGRLVAYRRHPGGSEAPAQ